MRLNLIEHHCLARLWMSRHGRANLSRPQTISALPFKLQAHSSTIGFDFRPVAGAKELFPRDIKPLYVVSNIHQPFACKLLSNRRVQRLINLPTIDNWSFAARERSFDAMKPDFERPAVHLRTFVVRKDGLIGRI